jgi:hypothetical protein
MRLCDEQVKHLQWSLQKEQDSSLFQAIIKGDNWYSYLHILHAMVADISTNGDCNKGTPRKWAQKALHGLHPHDLYQQNVDKKVPENGPTHADLLGETGGVYDHSLG